jgi:hypothetical protein
LRRERVKRKEVYKGEKSVKSVKGEDYTVVYIQAKKEKRTITQGQ